jgi:hypothetical protein
MGWSFRRKLKFSPLKFNLAKSGVSDSMGGLGFHIGRDAKGWSYTAVSIPGVAILF